MDTNLAKRIAIEAVKEAGKLVINHMGRIKNFKLKAKSDIVTDVDIKSEKILIKKINENFPDHSIMSEEQGSVSVDSEYTWVMDPIDGTINYYHAVPLFGIGLCLLKNGKPIISAVYDPIKDELYFAEKGKGATLNNEKITVTDRSELKNCVVMTHLSSNKQARLRTINKLDIIFCRTMHLRILGCSVVAMNYIASGRFDIFFNVKTSPWDILPGSLLIEEAGGRVTDIEGNEITIDSTSVLATNGKVHKKMLRLLKNI